jgi:hypothetical protein
MHKITFPEISEKIDETFAVHTTKQQVINTTTAIFEYEFIRYHEKDVNYPTQFVYRFDRYSNDERGEGRYMERQ